MDPAKLERKQAVALQKQRAKQFIQYQLDASRQQTHAPAHPQFALQQSPDPQMRTQVIRPGPEACAGTQTVRIPDIRAGARTIQSRPQVENRTQIIRFPDPPGKQSSWTPDSDAQRMQSHADAQKTHADAQTAQTPDSASSQIVRTPHTGTQTTWAPDRAGAQTTGTQSTLNRMSGAQTTGTQSTLNRMSGAQANGTQSTLNRMSGARASMYGARPAATSAAAAYFACRDAAAARERAETQ